MLPGGDDGLLRDEISIGVGAQLRKEIRCGSPCLRGEPSGGDSRETEDRRGGGDPIRHARRRDDAGRDEKEGHAERGDQGSKASALASARMVAGSSSTSRGETRLAPSR